MRRNDGNIAHFGGGAGLGRAHRVRQESVAGKRRCFW
jgi:hypothetical protein